MTETERLEDLIRAGEYVDPAGLIAAGAADRYAELVAEGEANAERDSATAARLAQIDSVLDHVAAVDDEPRLGELKSIIGLLLAELVELANVRANAISVATNALRSLDAVGGISKSAEAWTGSLSDKRDPRFPRNYVTGSSLDAVVFVLRDALPQAIKVGLRTHPAF